MDFTFCQYRNPELYKCKPKIVVTQPRRIAAKSLAKHVASERRGKCGASVGYRIGQEKCSSSFTQLVYVTTGNLLQVSCFAQKIFK